MDKDYKLTAEKNSGAERSYAVVVVNVRGVGKKYRISGTKTKYNTLRDSLEDMAKRLIGLRRRLRFVEFWALRDVAFDINAGERIGIIGRNGAGKSTLLKILSRIVEPTSGTVRIRGRVGSLLEVGTGFHPELTGRENIYLNGSILGMSKAEVNRKFDEIVEFAGISDFLDTPVKRYSSGMGVRLGFSVAAHLEPEILIVDEVLAVGDIEFQSKCLGKMNEVARTGRTVLFVSHNVGAVRELTERCIWLEEGQVRYDGHTGDTVRAYVEQVGGGAPSNTEPGQKINAIQRWIADERYRFESIIIDDPQDRRIPVGGDISLKILIHVEEPLPQLRIGYAFTDEWDQKAFAGFTSEFSAPRPGTHTARVTIREVSLCPGSYTIDLSLGAGDHHTVRRDYDAVKGAARVTVVSSTASGGESLGWNRAWSTVIHQGSEVQLILDSEDASS